MTEQINVGGLLAESENKPISVQVTVHESMVVTHYSEPREWVAMLGEEAIIIATRLMANAVEADPAVGQKVINLCMGLIDHVYTERGDLKPAGGAVKHELVERHRKKLTQRLSVMLNSTREKKTVSNQKLAKELVEAMLKEVFS
jgi:hypothetical protein